MGYRWRAPHCHRCLLPMDEHRTAPDGLVCPPPDGVLPEGLAEDVAREVDRILDALGIPDAPDV